MPESWGCGLYTSVYGTFVFQWPGILKFSLLLFLRSKGIVLSLVNYIFCTMLYFLHIKHAQYVTVYNCTFESARVNLAGYNISLIFDRF